MIYINSEEIKPNCLSPGHLLEIRVFLLCVLELVHFILTKRSNQVIYVKKFKIVSLQLELMHFILVNI
jgi:hypothetical protein